MKTAEEISREYIRLANDCLKRPPPSAPSAKAAVENHAAPKLVDSDAVVGPLAQRHWKAPFRYNAEGAMIWDASGERALDVRGWGRLTGKGALALSDDEACKIQDDFGESVVRILNASWPNGPGQGRAQNGESSP